MSRLIAIAALAALVPAPLLASPPAKRTVCQAQKAPARDAKRAEPCRRPAIPPVIDPTPVFLASVAAVALSDLR